MDAPRPRGENRVKYPTLFLLPDEPCYGLAEMPRMVAGRWRWVQAVYVVRDDTIAEWTADYGPAEHFARIQPIILPSPDGCNTVAQLQEHADKNRVDDYWAKRADELSAESTLIKDHLDQFEQDRLEMRNRSVFGPAVSVQRFQYSQERTRRLIKERTHG